MLPKRSVREHWRRLVAFWGEARGGFRLLCGCFLSAEADGGGGGGGGEEGKQWGLTEEYERGQEECF
ncbi:unnamed protein product [Enterobius vermicularis]|uniref:Uncharacterized protein n=1 Tax=Enterobius vermicularis TaxID=51028 RepID=A0A0N4UUI7_ENTVE|nr:unnamed protein product [Enterobius vermicularis]